MIERLLQDLKFSLRSLRHDRGVVVISILSLALAIAGNLSVFGLINGLLWRPLPYPEPHRLSILTEADKARTRPGLGGAAAANYLDWKERQRSYQSLGAFRTTALSLTDGDRPIPLTAAAVTAEFFPLLAAQPLAGRLFSAEESLPNGPKVAILSHALWKRRFAGQGPPQAVVGKSVQLNQEAYAIVGVMPENFEFLDPRIQIFTPLAIEAGSASRARRDTLVVGRLKPGVSEQAAEAELAAIATQLEQQYPETNRGYVPRVINLREEIPDPRNRQLYGLLQGGLLFVLLIACVNIANLLLARAQRREREVAIRSSLGASPRRLTRQMFTESFALAGASGVLGLILGWFGLKVLGVSIAMSLPAAYQPVLDLRVIGFTLGITALAAVLFGTAPALASLRFDLVSALKEGGRGAAAMSVRRRFLSRALVVLEISLALVLLAGAGLVIRSVSALQKSDPGFKTSQLLTARISLPETTYNTEAAVVQATEQLTARLAALPGVSTAAASSILPRTPFVPSAPYALEGDAPREGTGGARSADWMSVTPDYFAAIGIPVREGRAMTADDQPGKPLVVVVNETFAKQNWPGETSVLGKRVMLQGRAWEVVGVCGNVLHGYLGADRREYRPTLYFPLAQRPIRAVNLVLRTTVPEDTLAASVRSEVAAMDRSITLDDPRSMTSIQREVAASNQAFTSILLGFGLLALLLAALGTYGVLAYSVAQRTKEIGVRMAIGADRAEVLRMVLKQGGWLALLGIVVGLPGVYLVTRTLGTLLQGFSSLEPWVIGAVSVLLAVVTLIASFLPANRASRVEPTVALGAE